MIQVDKQSVIGLLRFIPLEAFNISVDANIEVITEQFLKPKINSFFKKIEENQQNFEYFPYEKVFSDADFLNKQFKYKEKSFVQFYIYTHLMPEIKKSNTGKVDFKAKYCLTFDRDLTPNKSEDIYWGTLKLGAKPILYFIHLDFQEFLSFIKNKC